MNHDIDSVSVIVNQHCYMLLNISLNYNLPVVSHSVLIVMVNTVELQWLEHLWNHENMFETGVGRANECK